MSVSRVVPAPGRSATSTPGALESGHLDRPVEEWSVRSMATGGKRLGPSRSWVAFGPVLQVDKVLYYQTPLAFDLAPFERTSPDHSESQLHFEITYV